MWFKALADVLNLGFFIKLETKYNFSNKYNVVIQMVGQI